MNTSGRRVVNVTRLGLSLIVLPLLALAGCADSDGSAPGPGSSQVDSGALVPEAGGIVSRLVD